MSQDVASSIGAVTSSITLGTTYTENLSSAGDYDYFQLPQQSKNSQVTIDFTGLTSSTNDLLDGKTGEFKISIVTASDTPSVASLVSTNSTVTKGVSNTTTDVTASLLANTNYYVKVEKGTAFSSSNYKIKASMVETVESETSSITEANDSIADADIIVPNVSFYGTIGHSENSSYVASSATDKDVFVFTTGNTDGKKVKINIASTSTSETTFYTAKITDANNATKLDQNNSPLTTSVTGTSNGTLEFPLDTNGNTPAGTYYLWIEASDSDTFAASDEAGSSYIIKLGDPNDTEASNFTDFNQAPTVTIGSAISGLYGTANVTNSTVKTVSLNGLSDVGASSITVDSNTFDNYLSLSSVVTATDPDTDTANAAIANYMIGLYDSTVESTTSLSTAKSVSGADNLSLDSSTALGAVSITSTADDSGINFVITGKAEDGSTDVTETITGPAAGKTVTTSKLFNTITSIDPSDTPTGNISVGAVTSGRIVYDSDGDTVIDSVIVGQTSKGVGFFNSLTPAQFATAKYVGASGQEVGQQELYVAVVDNSTATIEKIKTSGIAIQGFSTKNVFVSVSDNKSSTLKEGDTSTDHTLTIKVPGDANDGSITEEVRVVLSSSNDLSYGGGNITNNIVTLTDANKSKTVTVSAVDDGQTENEEQVSISFTVTSNDAAYEGLSVSPVTMTVKDAKSSFSLSSLNYGSDSVANSLKQEGLSQTSTSAISADSTLTLNGPKATAATGSGFASAQRIAITNSSDESDDTTGAKYVIVGTSDGSASLTETIQGGAAGKTVYTTGSFKTIDSITVTVGAAEGVSAGIASILEGDTGNNQKVTYDITATELVDGKTLTLNLGSTITAEFDYGTAAATSSRDFTRDDDLVVNNHAQTSSALTLTGTTSFDSPHAVTITSVGDDSGITFAIVGTDANGDEATENLTGATAGATATSTNLYKTITSITPSGSTANTVDVGITDEGKAITVTAVAAQDSTVELNPHMPTVSHTILEDGATSTVYIGAVPTVTVAVQDNNVPTASDGIVQTAKLEDNVVSALSSGAVNTTDGLTIANGTFNKAHKITITSTGDDSGITYTIVGTDASGEAQTETNLTGASAGGTATSTKLFKTITSIKPVGGNSTDTVKAGIYPQITFTAADFGYTDGDGDLLDKVTINSVPTNGELKLGSTVLTSGNLSSNNTVTAADLTAGNLVFTPAAGGSGSGYGNFTYTVNDGLQDAASANTMKVNIGDAVEVTVKSWKQVDSADVPTKSQTVTLKAGATPHDGSTVSGSFTTNDLGKLDLTGVANGTHTAGYTLDKSVADELAIAQSVLNATDVLKIKDMITGKTTGTSDELIAANVTWATSGDTDLTATDALTAADMVVGKTSAQVVFRDASLSSATFDPNSGSSITNGSNAFEVLDGNAMTLDTYLLGDVDGGYATVLAAL